LLLSALTGCNLLLPSLATPTSSPVAISTPTSTPTTVSPLPPPTRPPVVVTPSFITLTLWTTEAFSPFGEGESAPVLAEQLAAFEAAHPTIAVRPVLKKPYGKGGILDFLLTTSRAVPQALPDLVIIDTTELDDAVQAGLVQPLDDLLSTELQEDLFPFVLEAGRFNGQLMGVQFEADVEHLVYNTLKLSAPPLNWTGVLSSEVGYIFPAGGEDGLVNDAFLIQYVAAAEAPFDEQGRLHLEKQALTQVLQFYRDGMQVGIIPTTVLEYHTTDDCWPTYLLAEVGMANVSSTRYLAERDKLRNTAFAPIPTRGGSVTTITRGWALAVVTTDPARQKAAGRLIEWLMAPPNNAAWTQATGHLPTRRAAFDHLNQADDYVPFLHRQLLAAHARPGDPDYERKARALQQAVEDVVSGAASPQAAAAAVMVSVGQ